MSFEYKKLKPLRNDVLLSLKPAHKATESLIYFKEQLDHSSMQYFYVEAIGPEVKHVSVGDVVVCSWKRITPPFEAEREGRIAQFGITSETEIDCIVDPE